MKIIRSFLIFILAIASLVGFWYAIQTYILPSSASQQKANLYFSPGTIEIAVGEEGIANLVIQASRGYGVSDVELHFQPSGPLTISEIQDLRNLDTSDASITTLSSSTTSYSAHVSGSDETLPSAIVLPIKVTCNETGTGTINLDRETSKVIGTISGGFYSIEYTPGFEIHCAPYGLAASDTANIVFRPTQSTKNIGDEFVIDVYISTDTEANPDPSIPRTTPKVPPPQDPQAPDGTSPDGGSTPPDKIGGSGGGGTSPSDTNTGGGGGGTTTTGGGSNTPLLLNEENKKISAFDIGLEFSPQIAEVLSVENIRPEAVPTDTPQSPRQAPHVTESPDPEEQPEPPAPDGTSPDGGSTPPDKIGGSGGGGTSPSDTNTGGGGGGTTTTGGSSTGSSGSSPIGSSGSSSSGTSCTTDADCPQVCVTCTNSNVCVNGTCQPNTQTPLMPLADSGGYVKAIDPAIDNTAGTVRFAYYNEGEDSALTSSIAISIRFKAKAEGTGTLKTTTAQIVGTTDGFGYSRLPYTEATYTVGSGGGTGAATLVIKLKLPMVTKKPATVTTLPFRVGLTEGGLTAPVYKTVQFAVDNNAVWTGTTSFDTTGSGFCVNVKGPHHLQKKFCDAIPREAVEGSYNKETGSITINAGVNTLDFTNIYIYAGDLPVQNGVVNAEDTTLCKILLGKTDATSLSQADINYDGTVNSIDCANIQKSLGNRWDAGSSPDAQ